MIRIRDPLHGTITLSDTEAALLDTQQMQRLRGIRQLAMAYLVYPGANHTRFEHSIGTLALADRMCRELALPKEKAEKVRAAALLHDVGHVAFSHESEVVFSKYIGTHEEIGRRLMQSGEIQGILSSRFSKNEIAKLESTPLGEIISSDIGADRMDYLLRDSHYTGVAYGVIDTERICSTLSLGRHGLAIQERGLEAAESLLVARIMMFSTVYLHKTVRIASRMLQAAIALSLEDKTLDAREALSLDDSALLARLSASKEASEFASRIERRRLYKKAFQVPASRKIDREAAEKELSEKCGCTVLIDVPRISAETRVKVDNGGKAVPISSASELVASLVSMQKKRLSTIAMCEEKSVKKVATACERYFA